MSPGRRIIVRVVILLVLVAVQAAAAQSGSRARSRDARGRYGVPNGKNEAAVKAAFEPALAQAAAATVRIRADGVDVALGTVVDARGYIATKASLLQGKLTCRFQDQSDREAKLVADDSVRDLALLRVDAAGLTAIAWREGAAPPPGSLVATTQPGRQPVAVGVISTEPRAAAVPPTPAAGRAWLGIMLGGGTAGLEVQEVERNSPAARAGVRAGDQIKKLDGTAMASADEVIRAVGGRAPRQTVKLVVQRQNKELELSARLGAHPTDEDHWGGGPFSERRWGFPLVLPHDTPLHPADCGGPLVDTEGRAVGINIARALRVTTYALPAADARRAVAELIRKAQAARR